MIFGALSNCSFSLFCSLYYIATLTTLQQLKLALLISLLLFSIAHHIHIGLPTLYHSCYSFSHLKTHQREVNKNLTPLREGKETIITIAIVERKITRQRTFLNRGKYYTKCVILTQIYKKHLLLLELFFAFLYLSFKFFSFWFNIYKTEKK